MNYTIRPIGPEDAEGAAALRRMPGVFENTLGLPSYRTADSEAFIAGLGPDDHNFVAVLDDGTVIGCAGLTVCSNPRMRHVGAVGLFVHADYQGRGVGTTLMETLLDLADHWLMLVRVELSINDLEPNRTQPRQSFDDGAMTELADSIAQHGVLQPILVRPLLSGGYQIVAGERRWRASRMAGLTTVPAVIRDLTDSEVMQLALIENLQRENLKPLEEANGYKMLMDNFEFTQEEIAKTVGKSRPAITNALRLLNLPEDMQNMLERGEMTAGHARTLLSFKNEDQMKAAARRVTMEGISVRELEKMAKRANEEKPEKADKPAKRRIRYYDEAELALRDVLNRVVHISGTKKKAALTIEFYGEEDLKNLLYDLKLTDKTGE